MLYPQRWASVQNWSCLIKALLWSKFENRVDCCHVDCDAVKSRCKIPTFRVACGLHLQGGRLHRNFIDVMTTTEISNYFVTQQHNTALGRLIVEVCRRRIVKTSSAGTYTKNTKDKHQCSKLDVFVLSLVVSLFSFHACSFVLIILASAFVLYVERTQHKHPCPRWDSNP